jgi:hypothetical protein
MTAPKPAPLTAEKEFVWRTREPMALWHGEPEQNAHPRVWATLDAERAKVADLLAACEAALPGITHSRACMLLPCECYVRDIRAALAAAKGGAS